MNNWERFNERSENYDLYRPRYPGELLELLEKETGLGMDSVVADVGSGTGLLAELIIQSGCNLFCIEPNEGMRSIALKKFTGNKLCTILGGTAENTSLHSDSIDLITVGQAFHWFEPKATRVEFKRILKQNGQVLLVWNTRSKSEEGMNVEYERLVKKYSKEYHASGMRATNPNSINEFFGGNYRSFNIKNLQKLDLTGLIGRYLSASYAVKENDPLFINIKKDFTDAFERYEAKGKVSIEYETEVVLGKIEM